MGKAGAARKLASAAALRRRRAVPARRRSLRRADRRGQARAQDDRRAVCPTRCPTRPAGTAAAGPAPRSRSRCFGDSSACGYGVDRVEETPGALLASGVADQGDRRVYLREFCVVGAVSADLAGQIDRALPIEPRRRRHPRSAPTTSPTCTPPSQSVRHLSEGVRRLREAGVDVVVGTCPDLGTIKPIAPPLKQVARAWSRRLAAAQTIAVIQEGGRTVSLGSVLGPEFAAAPALLFGPDQFHPSAEGYRALARILLPSVLAAPRPGPRRRGRAPRPTAARASCPSPGGPRRRQRARHRARRHRGRRRRATAYAGAGSSCATAAAVRRPRAPRPSCTRSADAHVGRGGRRASLRRPPHHTSVEEVALATVTRPPSAGR